MGIPVLILGESGCGKSTSMRNLNPDDTVIIQPIRKRLPFRNKFTEMSKEGGQIKATDNAEMICRMISGAAKAGKKLLIIDDFQYVMAQSSVLVQNCIKLFYFCGPYYQFSHCIIMYTIPISAIIWA